MCCLFQGRRLIAVLMLSFFLGLAITYSSMMVAALNFLPVAILYFILLLLTRRYYFSFVAIVSLTAVFYYISYAKMENMELPLLVTDLNVLRLITIQKSVLFKYLDWQALILSVASIGGHVYLLYKEKPQVRLSLPLRVAGLTLVMAFFFLFPVKPIFSKLYSQNSGWIPWDPVENTSENGLFATLVNNGISLDFEKRMYDENVIDTFLHDHKYLTRQRREKEDAKPDIIAILAESFFDPSIIKGVPGCFYTPIFCELKGKTSNGYLKVPTYGGYTIRTEFEFLTGVALTNYPDHAFPYLSLVTEPIDSYPRYLGELGYETIAIHPFKRRYWNRMETFLQHMGFDHFVGEEGFLGAERDGYYIADREITPMIFKYLRDDRPQFIFVITMENHGPWGGRDNSNFDTRTDFVFSQLLERSGLPLREFDRLLLHFAGKYQAGTMTSYDENVLSNVQIRQFNKPVSEKVPASSKSK